MDADRLITQRPERAALVLLIALVGAAHLVWMVHDTGLMPQHMSYGYLIRALEWIDGPSPEAVGGGWASVTR